LKRVWNRRSSYVVRRKFMSNRWFKFRFLTTVYYKKEWHDDYYRTNFLVNRFWRNRIFKTFFRWRGFRQSKFAMKFFKFYNVYRYNKKRGFMDNFSAAFLNVSSFASVAFSHGFTYFKSHFYTNLINKDNNFKFFKRITKNSDIAKWFNFKKVVFNELVKHINSNKLYDRQMKFSSMYKVYAFLKNKLKGFTHIIYCYINFYFFFRFHNRSEYNFVRRTRTRNIVKLFRALKSLCKFPRLVEFYNWTAAPYKRFQLWLLKNFL